MTIIKINAITVPADSGDELAERFAARAGVVDEQPVGVDSEVWSYEIVGGSTG